MSDAKPKYIYRMSINGKFYVGATRTQGIKSKWISEAQKSAQRDRLSPMERAILQTPREKIFVKVLETLDDESLLFERLEYWISKFNSRPPHGYNALRAVQP